MSEIKFVRATVEDVSEIYGIVRSSYQKWVSVIGREPLPMIADYKKAISTHQIDLLKVRDETVGLIETESRDDFLWIENIAVCPIWQSRGYGSMLLKHAEALAYNAKKSYIYLQTNAAFQENLNIYQRNGYVITKKEPFMGGFTVYMTKVLPLVAKDKS